MKKLCFNPFFILGLLIRLALIVTMAPHPAIDWYVPFLDITTAHLSVDPWAVWLKAGGAPAAFPYGYVMWIVFLPLVFIAKLIGFPLQYGYQLTLLAADFVLLFILHRLLPGRQKLLLVSYWLSPIIIVASYGLGLNDLIPVLLLILSIYGLRQRKFKLAGAVCVAAVSAKLSMLVALPFFLIYLYNNKALRQGLAAFLIGLSISTLFFATPFIFSSGGMQMLFSNPEMKSIYRLMLNLGGNISIYIVPLIYMMMLYLTWRFKRFNFDLFQAATGLAFLLIVLMIPGSPGWFVWSMPFLAFYQAMSGRIAMILVGIFSGLYVLSTLLITPLPLANGLVFDLGVVFLLGGRFGSHAISLLHTVMVAIGVMVAIRIWREAISRNDFFRLSRKPFIIGIAGDSGAGKDSFTDAISGLFGQHSVVKLSGDDYHLWDRQKPMWQVMTHLNPTANDLEGFCHDLVSLADGKAIQSRHYDHQTGKMSRPLRIKSNDFIIASGLHVLYLPMLRECYNLKIYLDINEGLRRHFKLKRDVYQRGHTIEQVLASFEKREPDSARFIRPQSSYADLILSLQPIHRWMLEKLDDQHPLRLQLVVKTRRGLNEFSLNRVLIGVCGLHIDMIKSENSEEIQMTIEGETSAADVAMAAEILCPQILEFLDIQPKWQDGMAGLMQLVTLSHINQALIKRFIQ